MEEFIQYFTEQAAAMKLAAFIWAMPNGRWRIQINWTEQCKRGGDMIIAFAEEMEAETAYKEAYKRLKEWIKTHKEEINERIRNM